MLAVAALARATASHAYAYGARRLGAPGWEEEEAEESSSEEEWDDETEAE